MAKPGKTIDQGALLSYVSLQEQIPKNSPLHKRHHKRHPPIDAVLASMDQKFEAV